MTARLVSATALLAALPALALAAGRLPFAEALIGVPALLALIAVREAYDADRVARLVLASTGLAHMLDAGGSLVATYLAAQLLALAAWTVARRRVTLPHHPPAVGPRPIIGP